MAPWEAVSIPAAVLLVCVIVAQRLAHRRGRPALRWMMAAALLGPLPLIPLAMMSKRIFHHL